MHFKQRKDKNSDRANYPIYRCWEALIAMKDEGMPLISNQQWPLLADNRQLKHEETAQASPRGRKPVTHTEEAARFSSAGALMQNNECFLASIKSATEASKTTWTKAVAFSTPKKC